MTKSASLSQSKRGSKPTEKNPKASSLGANKNKAQLQNNNHASTIRFEEKIYRETVATGLSGDVDDVTSSSTEKPANGFAIAEATTNSSTSNNNTDTNAVPLPFAVRSCWPDLFPTMSSAKKSIRKGIFFVKQQQQQQQQQSTMTAGPDATAICAKESSGQTKSSVNHPEPPPQSQHPQYKPPFKGKCGTRVAPGDLLLRKLPSGGEPRFQNRGPSTQEILSRAIGGNKLQIAYLDQHLAVVLKPHGMPVHKIQQGGNDNDNDDENDDEEEEEGQTAVGDSKDDDDNNSSSNSHRPVSMHEMLLHCLPMSKAVDPLRRPAAVHRLDRPTYGLLVVARTRPCARFLSQAFVERRRVKKCYKAILHGHLAPNESSSNFVRKPLGGKACVSEYSIVKKLVVVSANNHAAEANIAAGTATAINRSKQQEQESPLPLTLVDLILHTGRKHQLRKHMASLGHPIVGDARYGNSDQDEKLARLLSSCSNYEVATKSATNPLLPLPLLLAAVNIAFPHPEPASVNDTTNSGVDEVLNLEHCAVSRESKQSLDASRGILNVAIDMPESMMNILRNSKSDETCT